MDNHLSRILTVLFGLPLVFILIYLGGVWFLGFVLIVILLAQLELLKILEMRNYGVKSGLIIFVSILLGVAAFFGYFYLSLMFAIGVIMILLLQLMKGEMDDIILKVSAAVFGITYIGWLLSHAILLRNIDNNPDIKMFAEKFQGLGEAGFFYAIFVVACTFVNDIGAYYTGKWKGKEKLLPGISPGKTVEGTIGGIVCAIVAGVIVNIIFSSPLSYLWVMALGFVVSLTAICGDLVESMIKRSVGIKDSGRILPGHGGFLDRFDSLIFVFPVSYYFIVLSYAFNGVEIF